MSDIHIRHIKSYLEKTFSSLIDLSDIKNKKEPELKSFFLTRSLAAFPLTVFANISSEEAAKAVVDGGQDNGIDAVYFDKKEKILYAIQSKWKSNSKGTPKRGDIQKFIKGFNDLVNARYERFNHKFNNKMNEIDAAINDASTKLELILIYSSRDTLAVEIL